MLAINGSVVTVPLVGWEPLQPPEAVQLCASFALHCKVVEVPMATLVFVAASVTEGFAATLTPDCRISGGIYLSMIHRRPTKRTVPQTQNPLQWT